jgi:hypothetical protein
MRSSLFWILRIGGWYLATNVVGLIVCPTMSVTNYLSRMCKILEEHRSWSLILCGDLQDQFTVVTLSVLITLNWIEVAL